MNDSVVRGKITLANGEEVETVLRNGITYVITKESKEVQIDPPPQTDHTPIPWPFNSPRPFSPPPDVEPPPPVRNTNADVVGGAFLYDSAAAFDAAFNGKIRIEIGSTRLILNIQPDITPLEVANLLVLFTKLPHVFIQTEEPLIQWLESQGLMRHFIKEVKPK